MASARWHRIHWLGEIKGYSGDSACEIVPQRTAPFRCCCVYLEMAPGQCYSAVPVAFRTAAALRWTRGYTERKFMHLNNKNVVITGAARGIGAAMANRFAAEGANLVLADLEESATNTAAAACQGLGVVCNVANEEEVCALVATAEEHLGSIDLFCSNAGLYGAEPTHAASAPNDVWTRCWEVHVMAHVYAARAVLPGMIKRGDGYLLQMASAAGLLSQIGNAAYSATKHAAVGFAESLAITHANDGIKVSLICPQYVATPMLGYAAEEGTSDVPGVLSPERVAACVVEGLDQEAFLILPHPDVAKYIQFKAANYDKWLAAMVNLRATIIDETGGTDVHTMHRLV